MINTNELKDGFYYGQHSNFSYFVLNIKSNSITTPFKFNVTGDIAYDYSTSFNTNTYENENSKIITKREFYNVVSELKIKFGIKHLYIKTN